MRLYMFGTVACITKLKNFWRKTLAVVGWGQIYISWHATPRDGACNNKSVTLPRYGACKNKSVTLLHLSEAVWNLKLGRLNWTLTSRSRTRSDATVSCYRQISLRRPKIKLIKNTVMIQIPNTHIPEILKKKHFEVGTIAWTCQQQKF